MKIYLVGGAVRDHLLGRPVTERDFVVVGAQEQEMLALGYQKVGRDFPVFLHPKTKEEYALARHETKVGEGYKGFTFDANPSVTLEEDLKRRDLTINAMAQDEDGNIIDPCHGQNDLKERVLRHVSPAFVEDPLRVLRVARFATRYAPLGFRIADETRNLMYRMVKSGELNALVSERIWSETEKALKEEQPSIFFQVLREVGAMSLLFPEINNLFGIPQTKKWHGEIDTGVHCLMVLDKAASLSSRLSVRFSALVHDLGKATSSFSQLPSHHGHEKRGVSLIKAFCERLRVPKQIQGLAILVSEYHTLLHKVDELTPRRIINLLDQLDAYRRKERFADFLTVCEADALGRIGGNDQYPQADYLRRIFAFLDELPIDEEIKQLTDGETIKNRLYDKRIKALKQWLKDIS